MAKARKKRAPRVKAPFSAKELGEILANVGQEVANASRKQRKMASAHEGYGVILEELDESWEEIKRDNLPRARKEMVQVAAMAVRFLLDVRVPKAGH